MSLYDFKPDDAMRFAQYIAIGSRQRGNELQLKYCPYCHGGEKGDKCTFSINLETGAFNCKRGSCGVKGNMITLSKDFGFSLGNTVDGYYRETRKYRDLSRKPRPYTRPEAVRYLASRGISAGVVQRYGLTTHKEQKNVIVFPFFDEHGRMQFAKYRKTDFDPQRDSSKEWCEADCKPILFGMDQCNPENKTLIMTEGQIDSLSLTEAGIENAVSVPTGKNGFTWLPHCWDFLKQFDTLIVFGDLERGEMSLLPEMSKRFDGTVKHVRHEDYQSCKDANEILQKFGKSALRSAVANAVPVENPRIKCLSEVERVDLSQLERIPSGISALDGILGGLYLGQLDLLTGERGQGKSTLASQIGTFAMNHGFPTLFYSGELMDWMFADWIERQVVGNQHIKTSVMQNGFREYRVDPECSKQVRRWYEGRGYLYDNGIVQGGNEECEMQTLLQVFETAIKQYGCRVIIVDNLMTALEDDAKTDLYRQQSNFVKQLAMMAKRFNVLIILIAHPRKATTRDFGNDDIAGSSNITNLVDVVLRYSKPEKEDEDSEQGDRILTVHKNRLTGRLTGKNGIRLYFDEASKRISEFPDRFDWKLSWGDGLTEPDTANYEVPF